MRRKKCDDFTQNEARNAALLERYLGKKALMETWKHRDPEYAHRLELEVNKLYQTLMVKGVI